VQAHRSEVHLRWANLGSEIQREYIYAIPTARRHKPCSSISEVLDAPSQTNERARFLCPVSVFTVVQQQPAPLSVPQTLPHGVYVYVCQLVIDATYCHVPAPHPRLVQVCSGNAASGALSGISTRRPQRLVCTPVAHVRGRTPPVTLSFEFVAAAFGRTGLATRLLTKPGIG